jgi:integrase
MTPETPEQPEIPGLTGIDLAALQALLAMQPKPMKWAKFVGEIECRFAPPRCTAHYHRDIKKTCAQLAALGVATTFDLTPELLVRYVASCPPEWSPFTLKGNLVRIRTVCSHAVRDRRLPASPFATLPISMIVRLGKPQGKRHLTRAEIARLMEVLKGDVAALQGWAGWKARRLHFVVALGLYCGLRKLELLRLQVADVDLVARVIRLKPHNKTGRFKTKGSEAPVPIPDALADIIQDWLAHRLDHPRGLAIDMACPWLIPTCDRKAPWTSGAVGTKPLHRLQAAARRAGIEHATMHMLRRSCATHLEALGVPRSMIARILRHSGEQVTEEFYLRADEQNMVDAVKDLTF